MEDARVGPHVIWVVAAVTAFLALTAAGCGSSTERESVKDQIATALVTLEADLTEGDGDGVCRALPQAASLEIATSGYHSLATCEGVVEAIARRRHVAGDKARRWSVISVRPNKEGAIARVRETGGQPIYIQFKRGGDGRWRLATLEALGTPELRADAAGPGHDYSDPEGPPKIKIAEVLHDLQGDFPRKLGNSVCYELSRAGRRQVETSGIGSGTCEQRIPEVTRRALSQGFEPMSSKILWIRIDRRRATALVRDPGGPAYRVPFVKEGEDWKMPSLQYVTGLDLDRLVQPHKPRFVIEPDASDMPDDASDELHIREVLSDVQGDFGGGVPFSVCVELSTAGEKELARARGGKRGDCTENVARLTRRNRARRVPPRYSRVQSVKVNGSIATALVFDPNDPDKPAYRVPFLKEGLSGWKLPSLTYAEPVADILEH